MRSLRSEPDMLDSLVASVHRLIFTQKAETAANLSQQSRKLAAISSSSAISGAIGNSGISVELFVYRTLYVKYWHTFCKT